MKIPKTVPLFIYFFACQSIFFLLLAFKVRISVNNIYSCADLEGGPGGPDPPWNLQSLISLIDITRNEKISYFSYLCTSTVIRLTESILLKVGPPWKNFLDPRLYN